MSTKVRLVLVWFLVELLSMSLSGVETPSVDIFCASTFWPDGEAMGTNTNRTVSECGLQEQKQTLLQRFVAIKGAWRLANYFQPKAMRRPTWGALPGDLAMTPFRLAQRKGLSQARAHYQESMLPPPEVSS